MSIRKRAKLNFNPGQVVDDLHRVQVPRALEQVPRALEQVPRAFEQVPRALEQVPRSIELGVQQAASRVAGAADVAGARVGKGVAKAGRLGRLRPRIARPRIARPRVVRPRVVRPRVKAQHQRVRVGRRRRGAWNITLGALLMYHLDPKSGGARRALTARGLRSATSGLRSLIKAGRKLAAGSR